MPAPQTVLTLVENFERNLDAYRDGKYNETQVRRDFIDPLFKALGWDMDNSLGYAEAYRDVIHEDAIKVGISTRAPDYSFRIGGARKFFLEAKKPSVNVKDDIEPAFQLRRYGWSAKLQLSVLTDFEEFAVYDCRAKPDKNDRASKSRLFYFTFRDYAEKWDEIAAIFSKDAVLKGSFDKYASTSKGKRGTTEVDHAFLEEIENWRNLLAHNIALRNSSPAKVVRSTQVREGLLAVAPANGCSAVTCRDRDLTQRELNFAVQQTIDRIIFLRICEDRGIEPYGKLMALQNGVNVYARLREMFRDADDRYNSGLFHFKREKGRAVAPDELTLHLEIDDKPLKEIFKNLYYPDCPYEFSVLGADILGSVYEQFLGKVIRLTSGNRAVVEDKPEVKKAGGVFYTPAYIVQYIVEHTVGKLLEGKTSKQATGIAILDPACGSGSFLIGAYQYLLDWYLAHYVEEGAEKNSKGKAARIRPSAHGTWRLTTAEKKRILLEHIYGVDIDAQAVEVTKLSLLLKMLEGESDESLISQGKLFHERVLPDLERNIQCGNSLIGPDFYDGQLDLDDEAAQRINVFDWQAAFPQVFKAGGFDVVIGNPPWGAEFGMRDSLYLVNKYPLVPTKTKDSYFYFICKAIEATIKNGLIGFIVPNTWLLINTAKSFRQELLSYDIDEIRDYGDGVFKKATVESSTFILRKLKKSGGKCRAVRLRKGVAIVDHEIPKSLWLNDDEYSRIIIENSPATDAILKRLKAQSESFGNCCTIIFGIKPYQVGHGTPPQTKEMLEGRIYHAQEKRGADWKPLLVGTDVNRYQIHFPGNQFIKYGKWLMYPSNGALMDGEKVLMRRTSDKLRCCYDDAGFYCQNSVFIVHSKILPLKLLLALLNSRLLGFVYKLKNPQTGKVFAEVKPSVIKELPVFDIGQANAPQKLECNKIVSLVEKMLALHQQLASAKTPQDTTLLQR
jgi:predicted type IV restriction endonuclease